MIKLTSADSPRRVPAEWEPQAGVWLQWPGRWERSYESAFARISSVIVRYQPLHILYSSKAIKASAKEAIKRENKKTFVVMQISDGLKDEPVELGWRDGGKVDVTSGLNEGDQVGIPDKPLGKKRKSRRRRR